MALSEKQVKLVESILYQADQQQLKYVYNYCVRLQEWRNELTEIQEER
jgi:hypothetical protein